MGRMKTGEERLRKQIHKKQVRIAKRTASKLQALGISKERIEKFLAASKAQKA